MKQYTWAVIRVLEGRTPKIVGSFLKREHARQMIRNEKEKIAMWGDWFPNIHFYILKFYPFQP